MQIESLDISDVKLIIPKRFGDERGFFVETYSKPKLAEAGITDEFVQDNHSLSRDVGVLRGLHFQRPPHAQSKLVRVTAGRVLDVAVDLRQGSPTFGQHVTAELSGDNGHMLYVPVGFAHGFVTLEPNTEFLYKVGDVYAPDCDGGVMYNDPDLGIDWPLDQLPGDPILSRKDAVLPKLAELDNPFVYDEVV